MPHAHGTSGSNGPAYARAHTAGASVHTRTRARTHTLRGRAFVHARTHSSKVRVCVRAHTHTLTHTHTHTYTHTHTHCRSASVQDDSSGGTVRSPSTPGLFLYPTHTLPLLQPSTPYPWYLPPIHKAKTLSAELAASMVAGVLELHTAWAVGNGASVRRVPGRGVGSSRGPPVTPSCGGGPPVSLRPGRPRGSLDRRDGRPPIRNRRQPCACFL